MASCSRRFFSLQSVSRLLCVNKDLPVVRCCSNDGQNQIRIRPPGKIKIYFVDRLMSFYQKSEITVSTNYPNVYNVYHTFKTGMVGFFTDAKIYFRVSKEIWSGKSLKEFTRLELEVYSQLRRDLWRLTPLLIIAGMPMGFSIFPVAYMFPRLLLSHHFWTPNQKKEFYSHDLKKQIDHYSPIIHSLKHHSRHIADTKLQQKLCRIIGKLEHHVQPSKEEILQIKALFKDSLYNIDRLSTIYIRHLAKSLRLSLRRNKLKQDTLVLLYTDLAMRREGISTMLNEDLERACFIRGLNPIGLRREERILFLYQWTDISRHVNELSLALLLHSPVFLTSAHPTNQSLSGRKLKWRRTEST